MIKEIMVCDMCGDEIQTYEKEIIKGHKMKFYKIGIPKYMPNYTNVFHNTNFCEKCAAKIDVDILEWKMKIFKECGVIK